ncbi:DUF2862 domain-containing protein [Prochlorococcus sp. MIT 1223]|uniref:DUF2862 domain-containing protein n=1 Tax=Prochlorococcus sp. MIT 1223 TaxID=3096217 RepID=UPI002A765CC8|nr:DUF2862 domain-containing protein [Prochlorococcus sp. MIT 1223]
MIKDSSKLIKGQKLKVDLDSVEDRLSIKLINALQKDSVGRLVGYKMVDGNQFGLVVELNIGITQWFFEKELSEIDEP